MKRMLIAILAGLLAGTAAHADESARLTKVDDWFLGEWTVTFSQDGETKSGTLSVKLGAGGRCHVGIGTVGNVTNQMLFGRDPGTKRWTGTSFASDGSSYWSVLDEFKRDRIQKDDTRSSSFTRVAADGTTTTSTAVWTIVDEKTFTIKYTQRKQGDKKLPDITERYVRKNQTATYEDFLEWGNRLEGRWVGKVTLIADWPGFDKKKGNVVECHWTTRWIADKRGLEQIETLAGTETRRLYYYDAGAKQIKVVYVNSGGTTFVASLGRNGDEWPWTLVGHLSNGTKEEAKGVVILKGDGNMVIKGTGTLGGKEMLTLHDVYTKVSKEPSK